MRPTKVCIKTALGFIAKYNREMAILIQNNKRPILRKGVLCFDFWRKWHQGRNFLFLCENIYSTPT